MGCLDLEFSSGLSCRQCLVHYTKHPFPHALAVKAKLKGLLLPEVTCAGLAGSTGSQGPAGPGGLSPPGPAVLCPIGGIPPHPGGSRRFLGPPLRRSLTTASAPHRWGPKGACGVSHGCWRQGGFACPLPWLLVRGNPTWGIKCPGTPLQASHGLYRYLTEMSRATSVHPQRGALSDDNWANWEELCDSTCSPGKNQPLSHRAPL